jgi:hypothetical protein
MSQYGKHVWVTLRIPRRRSSLLATTRVTLIGFLVVVGRRDERAKRFFKRAHNRDSEL